MTKPTLVIMAAGMGSRYGGLKQIDPVGPSGEMILDYSVYDALRAGFGRVVFIIKEEMETLFRETVGDRIASAIPVEYAYQRLGDLPEGLKPPETRTKPWGTAHAVYCCRDIINEPFSVINADDFYGSDAFAKVAGFLGCAQDDEKYHYCMAGYYVENTLTEHGHVARGVCRVSGDGYLEGITERTHIERRNGEIVFIEGSGEPTVIRQGTVVSMNMWGFTPSLMREFEPRLKAFLREKQDSINTAEFFLPFVVDELIAEGRADVRVLETDAKWYGVTYREDKAQIEAAVKNMISAGKYPERLWKI